MSTHPMLVITSFFGTHVNVANVAVGTKNPDGTPNVSGTVIGTAQTAHSWAGFVLTDSRKFIRGMPGIGMALGAFSTIDSGLKIFDDYNTGKSPQQSDIAGAIGGVAAIAGGAAFFLASGSVVVPLATVVGVGAGVWQFVASGQGWSLDDALYPIRQTLNDAQKSEVFDALRELSKTKEFNDALGGALGGIGVAVISADTLWSRPDIFEPASEFERSIQSAIDDALKAFKAAGMSADDALQRVAGKLDDYLQSLPFGHMGYASLATGAMGLAMSATMGSFYSNWKVAESTRSPLILDLDSDGVETLNESVGVYFDHAADGFAESTGWVGKDDGLLVRDLDGNDKITSGRELFGDHTLLANGKEAANGFEALKDLDGNGDGVLDAQDAAWASLRIWQDANGNGMTDVGELLSLDAGSVQRIGLIYSAGSARDEQGNVHKQLGSYTRKDGSASVIEDVWFGTSPWRTVDRRVPVGVTAEILALPNLIGPGNLGSLHQAMARDGSGKLQAAVAAYASTADVAKRRNLFEEILYRWAGVWEVAPNSRAPNSYSNPIGDARKLEFLESFFGEGFLGTTCSGARESNPHGASVSNLLALFGEVKTWLATLLDAQTWDKPYYDAIRLAWDNDAGGFTVDVSDIAALARQNFSDNAEGTLTSLTRFGKYFASVKAGGTELLGALHRMGDVRGDALDIVLFSLGRAGITFVGTESSDQINGNNADNYLFGLEGDDVLNGGAGDDILDGGSGNDTLNGGPGNDTYRFGRGAGHDVISAHDSTAGKRDVVELGEGVLTTDVALRRESDDLVLSITGTTDTLRIKNHFQHGYQIEAIRFADGTVWDNTVIMPKVIITTDGDDTLQGYASDDTLSGGDGHDRLYGYAGNDVLDGGAGNDTLEGGAGHDRLLGQAGHDLLRGGYGNDVLEGGGGNDELNGGDGDDMLDGGPGNDTLDGVAGNDTYRFGRGAGHDVIHAYDWAAGKRDVVELGEGVLTTDVALRRESDDLVLSITGTTDTLRIKNHFQHGYQIEAIRFADGTVWDNTVIMPKVIITTDGDDTLQGYASDDTLSGGDGHDRLYGYAGNDVLDGGAGNDILRGGDGNDVLEGGAGNDELNGGYGDDMLDGGPGNDTLDGGVGSDTYRFGRGAGHDVINAYDWAAGKMDMIALGAGVSEDQIWLQRTANDLRLTLVETSDTLTVSNWYGGPAYRVNRIDLASGKHLLDSQIDVLVSAMATFAPPAAGQTSLPADYQLVLNPVIAATWK